MTLDIESYFGGCLLSGPDLPRNALEAQLARIQQRSGGNRDGSVAALGRSGWQTAKSGARPQYRYDLDVGKLFVVKY